MYRHIPGALLAIFLLFALSCKKDLLHWQKVQRLNSNTTSRLDRVQFISNNVCLASGGVQFDQSEILKSVDGGYTWAASSNASAPKEMYSMCTSPSGTIYLSGIDGDVLYSKDTGATWQFAHIDNWLINFSIAYPTPDTGIYLSSVLQRQSSITLVDSAFNIISEQTFQFGLNNIYMTSPSTGYVVGYGAVMKTTDHGHSWNFQDVKGDNFTAMHINGNEIWMCGANGSIFHTTDGGNGWSRQRNGNDITLPHYGLRCIVFKDEQNGWAAGDDGRVIYTDDGGNHWMEYDQFTTSALRSIVLCPNGDLLVAGDGGALFRITPF